MQIYFSNSQLTIRKNLIGFLTILFFLFAQVFDSYSQACPFNEADLEIATGGPYSFTLTQDCTVTTNGEVLIQREFTIDGNFEFRFSNTNSALRIASPNGVLTIDAGTTLNMDLNNNNGITVEGTLNIEGTIDMQNGEDVHVNGGSVVVGGAGDFQLGDDLHVYNDGYFEVELGGTVSVPDDVRNDADFDGSTPGDEGAGTIIINGSMTVGDELAIYDTEPNDSDLSGTGSLTVNNSIIYTEEDGADFSGCQPGPCSGGSLPVGLTFFTVNLEENIVDLKWQTSMEINNDYFTIERSSDGTDWHLLNTVDGHGNSNTVQNYSLYDFIPLSGLSYYRLTQTDFDGTSETFDPAGIHYSSTPELLPYPNPASDEIKINIKNVELTRIEIMDISGKINNAPQAFQNDIIIIDISELTHGTYFMKMQSPSGLEIRRFFKD